MFVCLLGATFARAAGLPLRLGDLDNDGQATVIDLVRLLNHINGPIRLASDLSYFADINQDGFVNDSDVTMLRDAILGLSILPVFPIATVRETSPVSGEGDVSVNRETIVRLTQPLAANAVVGTNTLYATFGGRRILSRTELSSDRKMLTLFYLEPLPASARMRVTFDGNGLNDWRGLPLDADGDGNYGGARLIDFDTGSTTPVRGTAVIGWVYASQLVPGGTNTTNFVNLPLRNVTITVDGAEQDLRATTDINGHFVLTNCPAGRFFAHVDGRTAVGSQWPNGAYYPPVGKAWEAKAGVTTNLAAGSGQIYLPLVASNTLQTVSMINDTTVTFPSSVLASNPALAGVSITVPANSLFNEAGARGGRVGLAPVPPDRLPEPLPAGLKFPLVITVQTDGPQNFDRPVPVRFPNLPDPVTGVKLPPGAKTALWSFNHDTGKWEIQGPMTVTADGNFVESDLGVGIKQPGWHGVFSGSIFDGVFHWLKDSDCDWAGMLKSASKVGFAIIKKPASLAGKVIKLRAKFAADELELALNPNESDAFYAENAARVAKFSLKLTGDIIAAYGLDKHTFRSRLGSVGMARLGFPNWSPQVFRTIRQAGELVELVDVAKNSWDLGGKVGDCLGLIVRPRHRVITDEFLEASGDYLNNISLGSEEITKSFEALVGEALHSRLPPNKDVSLILEDDGRLHVYDSDGSALPEYVFEIESLTSPNFVNDAEYRRRMIDFIQNGLGRLDQTGFADSVVARRFIESTDAMNRLLTEFLNENESSRQDEMLSYSISPANETTPILRGEIAASRLRAIIAPEGDFTLEVYSRRSKNIAIIDFRSPQAGLQSLPPAEVWLVRDTNPDSDADGLSDEAEKILGTKANNPDTDGDGIPDGAEVAQGTDPLSNLAVRTGIIASSDTTGNAVDVTLQNNLAIVADSGAGIAVFNVSGLNPTRVAQVDTPGNAVAVAVSGNFVAVADDTAGIAIVDITDPPAARIIYQVNLGAAAQCVTAAGGIAYVGLANGQLVSVDLASGTVLERLTVGGNIQDVAFGGDALYVLAVGRLSAVPLNESALRVAASVSAPGSLGAGGARLRLVAGGNRVWSVHTSGFDIFNVTSPLAPVLIRNATDGQFGWRHLAPVGSGLAVACDDPASTSDGAHDVSVYNIGASGTNNQFLTRFPTPGSAYSVSIYNGLAYVADGASGLQVINYLAYDSLSNAPSITLTNSFIMSTATNGVAEEGKLVRATALVSDDVQVRNVEFYVDGARQVIDGSFPFEHRFLTPTRTTTKTNFTLQAKATDTGGNFTWTPVITVELVPDATPPRVLRTDPANATVATSAQNIFAFFNEPIDQATLNQTNFYALATGADQRLGTSDDVVLTNAVISYRDTLKAGVISFLAPLPFGLYRAVISPFVRDLAGNAMGAIAVSTFAVLAGGEDGDEDLDGLTNKQELALGTNPLSKDTDGDGWDDDLEVADGKDPLDSKSRLQVVVMARPRIEVVLPGAVEGLGNGVTLARPPVQVVLPGAVEGLSGGVTVARPPVQMVLPGAVERLSNGVTVARPPVAIVLSGGTEPTNGVTVARSPVFITIPR